jgi:D-hexose-6-phosphate mutarotase
VVATEARPDGAVGLALALEAPEIQTHWPAGVRVRLEVMVGAELRLALATHNAGDRPLRLTEALHTYFAVADVSRIAIRGLEGCTYIDKVAGGERRQQAGAVTIGAETDRIYLGTESTCVIDDPALDRRIVIAKVGSRSTVVWNPWVEKARAFTDLPDEGYRTMVCVETANAADDAITLPPGETHVLGATLRLTA